MALPSMLAITMQRRRDLAWRDVTRLVRGPVDVEGNGETPGVRGVPGVDAREGVCEDEYDRKSTIQFERSDSDIV